MKCCGKEVVPGAKYCAFCAEPLGLDKTYFIGPHNSINIYYVEGVIKIKTDKNINMALRNILVKIINLIIYKYIAIDYITGFLTDSAITKEIEDDLSNIEGTFYFYKYRYDNEIYLYTGLEISKQFEIELKVFDLDTIFTEKIKYNKMTIYYMRKEMNNKIALFSNIRSSTPLKKEVDKLEAISILLGLE